MKPIRVHKKGRLDALSQRLGFVRSKRVWKIIGISVVAVIVLQLLFPYDRAFFMSTIDSQAVGLQTKQQITDMLDARYKNAVVITDRPASRVSFEDAGIKVNTKVTAERATAYPIWQRIIPFSSVFKLFSGNQRSIPQYIALSVEQWASNIEAACAVTARDAGVQISGSTLSVAPGADGASCPKASVAASLKRTPLAPVVKVDTARQTIKPKRSDQAVQAQIRTIQAIIAKGVSVDVAGTVVRAEPNEIVQWLTFTDGPNNQLKLDVDPAKLTGFITRVQRPVYVAPGTTSISLRDGVETGRTSGVNGQGIDSNDLIVKLREQLNQSDAITLSAKIVSLPPRTVFNRSYTNSTAGLQALINDIAGEHASMAIAITEFSSQRRNVSANGDRQFHPASTYKLFIAYSLIKRIEANQLKWDDAINGTTIDDCLTRMIVNSDNACAEALNEKFGGWKATQADVKGIGATGTDLNRAEPVGTVKDQALFLQKLNDNQLMKPENKDKLLMLMKRQRYRSGIPAGTVSEVADKVGFLSGNLHDSAIIYSPKGVYALSIYSTGGTWGDIADATRRIEALLNS